jgi:hypothetical protein
MIQRRAEEMDPVPKSSGRKTDITPEEKLTAKRLVLALGYSQSRDTILKWRSYWKFLSDLRNQGATTLLRYRTSEFKTYVFPRPNQLDMLLSWNQVYDFPLQQLRLRVIAQEEGDFSGRCDIEDRRISERLRIPHKGTWGNDLSH